MYLCGEVVMDGALPRGPAHKNKSAVGGGFLSLSGFESLSGGGV